MKASAKVAEFLSRPDEEGDRLTMYQDQHGCPTIGVGHLLTKNELYSGKVLIGGEYVLWHQGITEEQSLALMMQDIRPAEAMVDACLKVAVSQNQFDALVIFTFNVGIGAFTRSTLLRVLNEGEYGHVPDELRKWVYVAGKVSKGLERRREGEIAIWEGKA